MAKKVRRASNSGQDAESVDAFLAGLEHPMKAAIEDLRAVLRRIPGVAEGIKWNAVSFRTTEWFLTTNVHGTSGLRLILHRGAKKRTDEMPEIPDPGGILTPLGRDRGMVAFRDAAEYKARRTALSTLIKAWLKHV